jgi:uncharacterized MAPEG superfamily protein
MRRSVKMVLVCVCSLAAIVVLPTRLYAQPKLGARAGNQPADFVTELPPSRSAHGRVCQVVEKFSTSSSGIVM